MIFVSLDQYPPHMAAQLKALQVRFDNCLEMCSALCEAVRKVCSHIARIFVRAQSDAFCVCIDIQGKACKLAFWQKMQQLADYFLLRDHPAKQVLNTDALQILLFHHSADSPVVLHLHEAMRHGGWQARRFFRLQRACRFLSPSSALIPP